MKIDQLLKRHFWAVILVLVGILASLHAKIVSELVGLSIAPDEKQMSLPPVMATTAPAASATPPSHTTSAEAILARNPFDSVTGPLNKPPPVETDTDDGPDMSDPRSAPPCGGLTLLVLVKFEDPAWSFAAFNVGGDKKSILRRTGQEVGGKTIEHVGWDRVWLKNGHALCQEQLFKPAEGEGNRPATPTPTPEAPPPRTGGGGVPPEIAKGIQKVGATEFNIDRGVVDKILENQAELMKQARIVPEQENGKVVGIRLFGVRPDTLLGTLGMESGDRLEKINGFDMASPEKALEAYARLRTADHLTVQINRRGGPVNLDFNIK